MEDPEFLDKLRSVFDVCDEDDDGLIAVDHFEKLAVEHFGASGIERSKCIMDHRITITWDMIYMSVVVRNALIMDNVNKFQIFKPSFSPSVMQPTLYAVTCLH
ncbi:hypothetical protein LOTGIDRAFT_230713 [Lottia gigantea]|uniref:EF-hand domain-containing protein n=1 Tax=Lottia gigantea TaxID=225164 RepID=V4B1Z6_LOTGI|nr:hypothetical protein LOTGIDRAFT_230713 [Lottia gigantea]ESP01456.1 hypothetical protein LOTGIDRAFT_230713 [Lottia gigantea]